MKELFKKYREQILYVFFGGCTTLVNIVAYFLSTRYLAMGELPATILAWILSVVFAYITNRIWVFQSTVQGLQGIIKEIGAFFAARGTTGLLDLGVMYLFVTVLHCNDMVVKIVSNIVVIILNYVISKLLIFRRKGGTENEG